MLRNFFEKSVAERTSYYSDERAICLHTVFLDSMQATFKIAEKVYDDFLLALKPIGMFDAGTSDRGSVKIDELLKTFQSELLKWDGSYFMSDFFLKTDKIKNKADLKKQEKKLLSLGGDCSYEDGVFCDRLQRAEKYAKQFSGDESKKAFIKELLHCTKYAPTFYNGCADANIDFNVKKYGTKEGIYQATLSVRIRCYSLGTNLNDTAEYMRNWLERMAYDYGCVSGFVGKGALSGQFDSPQMVYFSDYKNGIVQEADGNEYEAKDWVEVNFAEGIEWANVFSDKISDKILDIEIVKKISTLEIKSLNMGNIAIFSTGDFSEFSAEDVDKLNPYFFNCLRPGSSTIEITNLRMNVHDLSIPESAFAINGKYVTFSRGNFDFITKPMDEILANDTEQSNITDYDRICTMMETNFGAKCIVFYEDELCSDDIARMIVKVRNSAKYPLIICADTPVTDYLDELSKSDMIFEEKTEIEYNDCQDGGEELRREFQCNFCSENELKQKLIETGKNHTASSKVCLRECIKDNTDENVKMIWIETEIPPIKLLYRLGFDNCIQAPFIQISMDWFNEYGAVPTVIGNNTIEYMLRKPIPKAKAMKVALEHFRYAPLSFQNVQQSIINYAVELTQTVIWHLEFI